MPFAVFVCLGAPALVEADGTAPRLEKRWAKLASDEPATAFTAARRLAQTPTATHAVLQRLLLTPLNDASAAKLIADLDDPRFVVRDRANHELLRRLPEPLPWLSRALDDKPSLELRRRLERLIELNATIRDGGEMLQEACGLAIFFHVNAEMARENPPPAR